MRKHVAVLLLMSFFFTSIGPIPEVHAQTIINLPALGTMINQSISFNPLQLKGMQVYADSPLHFDFLVDKGESGLLGQPLKDEMTRLAKYFLTCLTVPEEDMWVNLSPYEKDRIAPNNFGITQMGKDLLEQDYLLKQITASLSYPESSLGSSFWKKVYQKAHDLYGTTEIPVNTFNKVWIVPKTAEVYVRGTSAFVVNSQLDVMLEGDYLSMMRNANKTNAVNNSEVYTQILKEIILPELRKEINEGKNFAVVRQVYSAMILATWYKRHLRDGLLGKVYIGQNKVTGVDIDDKEAKEKIFKQYLKSFKKSVYNYVKEDYDPITQKTVARKYVSGGMDFAQFGKVGDRVYSEVKSLGRRFLSAGISSLAMASINLSAITNEGQILNFVDARTYTLGHPFRELLVLLQSARRRSMQFVPYMVFKAVSFGLPDYAMLLAQGYQKVWFLNPQGKLVSREENVGLKHEVSAQGNWDLSVFFSNQGDLDLEQRRSVVKVFENIFSNFIRDLENLVLKSQVKSMSDLWVTADKLKKNNRLSEIKDTVDLFKNMLKVALVKKRFFDNDSVDSFVDDVLERFFVGQKESFPEVKVEPAGTEARSITHSLDSIPKVVDGAEMPGVNVVTNDGEGLFEEGSPVKVGENVFKPAASLGAYPLVGVRVITDEDDGLFLGEEVLDVFLPALLEEKGLAGKDASSKNGDESSGLFQVVSDEAMAINRGYLLAQADNCGLAVVGRYGRARVLMKQGDEKMLDLTLSMMKHLSRRGSHQGGLVIMRRNAKMENRIQVFKVMKNKRLYRSDLPETLFKIARKKMQKLVVPPHLEEEFIIDQLEVHSRWATGSGVLPEAAHPHLSRIKRRSIWSYNFKDNKLKITKRFQRFGKVSVQAAVPEPDEDAGEEAKENVGIGIGHNGDNNWWKFFLENQDDDWIGVKRMRDLFCKLVHFGDIRKLAPGDSPPLALQIEFGLTMGDAIASIIYAHVMAHHKNVNEIEKDILTEEEALTVGEEYDRFFAGNAGHLFEFGQYHPEAGIKGLYVTQQMIDSDKYNESQKNAMREQLKKIEEFKKKLKHHLFNRSKAGDISQKLYNHWIGPEGQNNLNKFMDLLLHKFFTGDRETATREFAEHSKGTYGLFIQTPLEEGITLYASNQDVVLGFGEGIYAAASTPYALLQPNKDGHLPFKSLMYLKDGGQGEIADVKISKKTGELLLKIYSRDQKRLFTQAEINARQYQLGAENKNFKPLHQYKNEGRRHIEGLALIAPGVKELQDDFDNPESLNYKTAENIVKHLIALYLQRRMLGSPSYSKVYGQIHDHLYRVQEQCHSGALVCLPEEKAFLAMELNVEAPKSVLARMIKQRLNKASDVLAPSFIEGAHKESELNVVTAKAVMDQTTDILELLKQNRLNDLHQLCVRESKTLPPYSDKPSADILVTGYQNSLYAGDVFADMLRALMEGLNIQTPSANMVLAYNDLDFDLHSLKAAFHISKRGDNFPTKVSVGITANAIGEENVFPVTGRMDSPLSVAAGTVLHKNAPPTNRVLTTVNEFSGETATASEALLLATLSETVLFIARHVKKIFPTVQPLGMKLTYKNLEELEQLRKGMLEDAERITGYDVDGNRKVSSVLQYTNAKGKEVYEDVHELLVKRGRKVFANRFWSGPISDALFWTYLLALVPLAGAGPVTLSTGPSAWAASLDGAIALAMGGYLLPVAVRKTLGWKYPGNRIGPPANINVGAISDGFAKMEWQFLCKAFSNAFKPLSTQAHWGNYRDLMLAELGAVQSRGSLIKVHIPTDEQDLNSFNSQIPQMTVTRTGAIGGLNFWRSGGLKFTTSRVPLAGEPTDRFENIVLGGQENIPSKTTTESVMRMYRFFFDPWAGHLAAQVENSEMADALSVGGRLFDSTTTPGTAEAHTTQSGPGVPEVMPRNKGTSLFTVEDPAVLAKTPKDGGINMNSRLMDLKVQEEKTQFESAIKSQNRLENVHSITPEVIKVQAVTPAMLKVMLGEVNLN